MKLLISINHSVIEVLFVGKLSKEGAKSPFIINKHIGGKNLLNDLRKNGIFPIFEGNIIHILPSPNNIIGLWPETAKFIKKLE